MKKLITAVLILSLITALSPYASAVSTDIVIGDGTTKVEAEEYSTIYLAGIEEKENATNIGFIDRYEEIDGVRHYAYATYTLNVASAGYYDLVISAARQSGFVADQLDFYINSRHLNIKFDSKSTNDWYVFREEELGRVFLQKGEQTFKFVSKGSPGNIDYFTFTRNDTPAADITLDPAATVGDMDSDANINSSDALSALQMSVRIVPTEKKDIINGDIDCDGMITAVDALFILERSVGKIKAFPSDYTVYYDGQSKKSKQLAESIAGCVYDNSGKRPVVTPDSVYEPALTDYAVYVGNTSHKLSSDACSLLGTDYKCSISAEGRKIAIVAKTEQYLGEVCENFCFSYINETGITIPKTANRSFKGNFVNPITTGGDPDVIIYGGKYYMYTSGDSHRFHVMESDDMIHWTDKGECLDDTTRGDRDWWAPEVIYNNGRFIMCYSAKEGTDYNQHLAIATSDSPLGPFTQDIPVFLNTNTPSELDDSLFVDDDGSIYIYFSRWTPAEQKEIIFGAKLSDDFTSYSQQKRLIAPELPWEVQVGGIAEAPHMIKHNGTYYLTYSANTVTSPYYAVGVATSDSPLGTFSKYDAPVLSYTDKVKAPAHHTFTTSLDGSENFIVYHAWEYLDNVGTRRIHADRCKFTADKNGGPDIITVDGPSFDPILYPANN